MATGLLMEGHYTRTPVKEFYGDVTTATPHSADDAALIAFLQSKMATATTQE
jgi:hypothetical protein